MKEFNEAWFKNALDSVGGGALRYPETGLGPFQRMIYDCRGNGHAVTVGGNNG